MQHPRRLHGSAGAASGRFLVYVESRRHRRPQELEQLLLERIRECRRDRRPQVVSVDAEERPDLVERFRIRKLPAVLVLDDGIVRGRCEGPEDREAVDELAGAIDS